MLSSVKRKQLVLIGMVVLGVFIWAFIASSYHQRYELLQERYPNVPKEIVMADTVITSLFLHPYAPFSFLVSLPIEMMKVVNTMDICSINGLNLFRISDGQVAYIIGEDTLIDAQGEKRKAFCIYSDTKEKDLTFVLKNGESLKKTILIERQNDQVIMKRQNGYIVSLVK